MGRCERLLRRDSERFNASISRIRPFVQTLRSVKRLDCRPISRLSLPVVSALFALIPLLVSCSSAPTPEEFKGTVITDERQAQDFRLTDHFGAARSLHQDFAGKVVVLTFLYTECPDVCPIVANHLRDISLLLEDDSEAAIIVVSVDPQGDTVESARAYSERWQMADRWTYLVGDEDVLRQVWKAYYIDPYLHGPGRANSGNEAASSAGAAGAGVSGLAEQTGRVIHSAPIYIIDGEGFMRSAFTLPLEAEDVAHDVRLVSS